MPVSSVKVTVNGTTVNATAGENNTWTATIAAPNVTSYNVNDGHYYPVTVVATNAANTATTVNDQHATLGESLRLRVKETTAPTITIVSPTLNQYLATASPTIKVNLVDESNGSGIDLTTLSIKVDSATYNNTSSQVSATSITNGYQITLTPTTLVDGNHTVTVNVKDNDGNSATSATVSFTTDTVAPTLNVTNPATNGTYVSTAALNVTGTTSDSTSGTPTVTIKLNDADQGIVTVTNGAFSKSVTLSNGANTIVVTATDKAGKVTTVTRTITLDTSSPVIASVSISPNPVGVGESYTVTIHVTG